MNFHKGRKGAALIISMIFVLVFSALAVSLATMSGTNLQIANNQHKINCALANAESGLEVMRYWLSRVLIPSSTVPSNYFSTIVDTVQSDLTANNIWNFTVNDDGSVPTVTFASATGQVFKGQIVIDPNDPNILQVYAIGSVGEITRTIRVYYDIEPYEHPIFNFGLATRGPLNFPGNPTIAAANANWEADIYIESPDNPLAVSVVGNTNFDGDVSIGNPTGNVDLQGDVLIAGEQGQTAIDNHVFIGVDTLEFPVPDTGHFLQYATGAIIDSSTDISGSITLSNVTIKAGTNPYFGGNVTIQGILLIEPPNKVTFSQNVTLKGLIVAEGDVHNPQPGTNTIAFCGNFDTDSYPQDPQFDAIRHEVGSSIIAPGFSASFAGNFSTLEGIMAVSGLHFSGNVNAQIKGTIINYSESAAVVEGNATINFDRVGTTKLPAGFDLYRVLDYNPTSYSIIF
jgi:hypothetical protein